MITGSHIPETHNGIKFYRRDGELLKKDEAPIRAHVSQQRASFAAPDIQELPAPEAEIGAAYIVQYLPAFPHDFLEGLRIGVDLHSAVGRDILVHVLEKLGATCFSFNRTDQFVALDTEALAPSDLERARDQISGHSLDALVSTDGDGDRPLLIDENGHQVNGDVLCTLGARTLGAKTIITPLTSTTAIEKLGWFDKIIRTRIGSPYVVAEMKAQKASGCLVGFEANGGFLLGSEVTLSGGKLPPLPTRDALLPLILVLGEARAKNRSIANLCASLPNRFMLADRIKEVNPELGRAILEKIKTSPAFRALIHPGLECLCEIDTMDGIRLSYETSDIVHFRQSGNAPELRCYVETDSQQTTDTKGSNL